LKVWLINPPVFRDASTPGAVVQNLFYNSPPLGLAYLAAVLEEAGHEVVLTDSPIEGLTPKTLAARADSLKPGLIGFSATTSYFHLAQESATLIKQAHPEIPIGIGGPHFNGNNDLLIEHQAFDFGAVGEGERTIVEIVQRLEDGRDIADVAGVVTLRDEQLHFAEPRSLIKNLDEIPMPARHLLPLRKYVPMPNDQVRLPKTSMISSRGCPFSCTFCDKQTFGNSYRHHSAERTVAEFHHLEEKFGIRDVAFVDSTFTPNKKRIESVLDAMEADPPKASWTCSTRANVLDEQTLRRMRDLNCWRVRIAVESGNEQILEQICKGVNKEEMEITAKAADKFGLQVKAFFMVGHIGETKATIEDSIRFALKLPLKDITVQINTPLKGTKQWEQAKQTGTLLTEDTRSYSFFQPVYLPEGLSAQDLIDAQKHFYRRFYLNPKVIWRHIKAIRGISDVAKYIRAMPLVLGLLFGHRLELRDD
jgi:radical SAM superfamily enzyme YgiQ (UPF0313 family)